MLLEIVISKKAAKQFNSLPADVQTRIRNQFSRLSSSNFSSLDIKKLKGFENHYRLRIGDFRVRFEFDKPETIRIYWVGKRSQAYSD